MTNIELSANIFRNVLDKVSHKFKNIEIEMFEDKDSLEHSQAIMDDGNAHFCKYGMDYCVDAGNNDDAKAARIIKSGVKALERQNIIFDYIGADY